MQKRYLPISIATGILFLIALVGYLVPAASDEPPVRVLFDNKGGKVILNHASHVDTMGKECGTCHHTTGNSPTPPACSNCHAKKFDETFIADHQESLTQNQCASCHHQKATIANFSHADHEEDYTGGYCQSCHHDESIEAVPQSCSNCHIDGSNSVLSLRDANHQRCADCHDDAYSEGLEGCSYCHVRDENQAEEIDKMACSSCHINPTDQLIPTSMNAFHGKCMGCHEEMGSGPFGDDACYQCHMK